MMNVRFSVIMTGLLCAGVALAVGQQDKGKKGQSSFEQVSSLDQLSEKGVECVSKNRGDGYSAADLNKLRAVATAASGKDVLVKKGILKPGACYVQVCKHDKDGKPYFSQVFACHGPEKIDFEGFQVPEPASGQPLAVAAGVGFVAGAAVVGYAAYKKFGGNIFNP